MPFTVCKCWVPRLCLETLSKTNLFTEYAIKFYFIFQLKSPCTDFCGQNVLDNKNGYKKEVVPLFALFLPHENRQNESRHLKKIYILITPAMKRMPLLKFI